MYRVALINMPFAALRLPSIALTQIKSVLQSTFNEQVECSIHYFNHDFARFIGQENYSMVADTLNTSITGFGDWFFRSAAFPDIPDNRDIYFARHLFHFDKKAELIQLVNDKRDKISGFFDELIDKYALDSYNVVGFTSMFTQNMASFAMAAKIKERNPDIITVMGGANCERSMGRIIAKNVDAVDFVFSGYSLKTFPQFVRCLIGGEKEKCDEIEGVYSKNKVLKKGPACDDEIGAELDIEADVKLDYDDYLSSLDEKCSPNGLEPALLFETSRGCWWGERSQCNFCGLNGTNMKFRVLSPEKALRQFENIFKYHPRVRHFKSVDNIIPKGYLTEVLPHLKTPEDAEIFYEVKSNLNKSQIETLARAGVTHVQPGIESLSTATLKLMKKGVSAFQNITFLKDCLSCEVKPDWNLLLGFPGETEEVYKKYCEDLPLFTHLPPPSGAYPIRFDRFSPYFKSAENLGLELKPYDYYEMVYPFDSKDFIDFAYPFMDKNYKAPHNVLVAKWITKLHAHISHWQNRWTQKDKKLKPQLSVQWRGTSKVIYDSRSGEEVEHEITSIGFEILDFLTKPMPIERIADQLDNMPFPELSDHLEALQKHGLLFREKNRFLSLVVDYGTYSGYL